VSESTSLACWQAAPPEWRAFLNGIATGTGGPGGSLPVRPQAFVGRNFLIDEGLSGAREDSYRDLGAAKEHSDFQAWRIAHEIYLQERVFRRAPSMGLPLQIDGEDDFVCPETFRDLGPDSLFVASDLDHLVLRVEDLVSLETVAGASPGELKRLAEAYLSSERRSGEQELRDFLGRWTRRAQVRPMFAAFSADLEAVSNGEFGWEDRLRDALGLIHLDPGVRGEPIDVLVFRYPIRAAPRLRGLDQSQRPLAAPTVLDGRFSVAFCPSPRDSACGHVVDLSGGDSAPRREVVHPTLHFEPRHLWRMGSIRTPVNTEHLPMARALHLIALRDLSGRPDYAIALDGTEPN